MHAQKSLKNDIYHLVRYHDDLSGRGSTGCPNDVLERQSAILRDLLVDIDGQINRTTQLTIHLDSNRHRLFGEIGFVGARPLCVTQ